MQRPRPNSRVILLGIFLAGICLAYLALFSRSAGTFERAQVTTNQNLWGDWWAFAPGILWPQEELPRPNADSRALGGLISWRADPDFLSSAEISELSRFILQKSRQFKMSPVLVLSLIEVESGFRPLAVSHRGAVGLMQLMPATAEEIAVDSGFRWPGPEILEDPKSNIEFGLRYVADLKRQFSNPEHVITAYNIGPIALKRKLRKGEEVPHEYYDRVMSRVEAFQTRARSTNQLRPALWTKSWL